MHCKSTVCVCVCVCLLSKPQTPIESSGLRIEEYCRLANSGYDLWLHGGFVRIQSCVWQCQIQKTCKACTGKFFTGVFLYCSILLYHTVHTYGPVSMQTEEELVGRCLQRSSNAALA